MGLMAVALDFGGKCISSSLAKCYILGIWNLVINILPEFTSVRAQASKMSCHFKLFILKRHVKLHPVICNSKTCPKSCKHRTCWLVINILPESGYRDQLNWMSSSSRPLRLPFPSCGICDWLGCSKRNGLEMQVMPTKTYCLVTYVLYGVDPWPTGVWLCRSTYMQIFFQ